MIHDPVYRLMVQLSQKHFHVEWADGLEYILWHECYDDMAHHFHLEPFERHQLRTLADSTNTWFMLGDDLVVHPTTLSVFTAHYLSEFGDTL